MSESENLHKIGIDTMKVFFSDGAFDVGRKHGLSVQPCPIDSAGEVKGKEKVLWKGGVPASKAYCNTNDFQVDIEPDNFQPGSRMSVKFSVPKVATGSNYFMVDENTAVEGIRSIEQKLLDIGVSVSLDEGVVNRLDITRNIYTENSTPSYFKVLDSMQGKRLKKRSYGESFLFGNTKQQISVYDKNVEATLHGVDVSQFPQNTLRFELRLGTGKGGARKVYDATGLRSVKDFCQSGAMSGLGKFYVSYMKNDFFRTPVVGVVGMNDYVRVLSMLKEYKGRNFVNQYLMMYGASRIASQSSIETFVDAVIHVKGLNGEVARTTKSRMMKKILQDAQLSLFMYDKTDEGKPQGILYDELKTKVLMVA